jgi:hypothetical protein
LGIDKTFNVAELFVTTFVFKHSAVIRKDTGTSPIFLGPIFIHGSSTHEIFTYFFGSIASFLNCSYEDLVIGSDDEKAITTAIQQCFPSAKCVLCTLHLKKNVQRHLIQIGVDLKTRSTLTRDLFGEDSSQTTKSPVELELRFTELLTVWSHQQRVFEKGGLTGSSKPSSCVERKNST